MSLMPSVSIFPVTPLPNWIQQARCSISNEEYLQCAVSVAFKLTKHLCDIAGTTRHAKSEEKKAVGDFEFIQPPCMPVVNLDEIISENVMVSVPNTISQNVSSADFSAEEVTIIQNAEFRQSRVFETARLSQRALCFALGKILLELFSQVNPLSVAESELGSVVENNNLVGLSFSNLLVEDNSQTSIEEEPEPAPKRSTTSTDDAKNASQSMSMNARNLLQEQGLPLSLCQLVYDLLEAEPGNPCIYDKAVLSLEEAHCDLSQMQSDPQRFLYDHISPIQALEYTSLFSQMDCGILHGRERELSLLTETAGRVYLHAVTPSGIQNDFLVEAVFLKGHSGSGKSSILSQLVSVCNANHWFVLICKFDRQVEPLPALLRSLDMFFTPFLSLQGAGGEGTSFERNPLLQDVFGRISKSIMSSIDNESFSQLCELLPNLCKLSPMFFGHVHHENDIKGNPLASFNDQTSKNISTHSPTKLDVLPQRVSSANRLSPGRAGSGSDRLKYLIHIVVKAICSGGHPVTIILEDLHWCDDFTFDIIGDFIQNNVGCASAFLADEETSQGGLLLLGSLRDNEVDKDGFLMSRIKSLEQLDGNINVNRLFVGELPEHEVNKMLSFKLCLPLRHTRELAQIVHQKTRGSPLYTIEFLRTIIKKGIMNFSVKARRWSWDDVLIDMQMISDGVVELLTKKLQQLPYHVIETLKVASCVGQLNKNVVRILDFGQFVPDMKESLEFALKEGILDLAGPIYAFSHDLLQESTYKLLQQDERKLLHKKIGISVVQGLEVIKSSQLCTLAVDQINISKDLGASFCPVERASFARLNLAAGKHSIAASSYERARRYFEAGISLLHTDPWERQYALCLELHEMSVVVSFMDGRGKVESVASRLEVILSRARSFDDALNSRALHAKFMASQERYAEAVSGLLGVLSGLGEEFPNEICFETMSNEVSEAQKFLKDTTKDKILNLPPMKNVRKLKAMEFMGLLVTLGIFTSPMLVPLLCCRLMKMTFECGFCEDTIPGLAFMSHALLQYSNDIELASRIARIAESLISENPKEHSLRARLTLTCTIKVIFEPFQTTLEFYLQGYNSAKLIGDIDNAMICGMAYCVSHFFIIPDLLVLQTKMIMMMRQTAAHNRINVLHSLMSFFHATIRLIGNEELLGTDQEFDLKNNYELYHIAEETKNNLLEHHTIISQMYIDCYFREYKTVVDLGEKHRILRGYGVKRILDIYLIFFEGISALCLARDTNQSKWREIGEKSVESMTELASYSTWNFENKQTLLQAELHNLNSRHTMAERSYQSSIASAREHRFFHEEALALELYGIYLIENKNIPGGLKQLQTAIAKYKIWGATKKADDVKDLVELVHQTCSSEVIHRNFLS